MSSSSQLFSSHIYCYDCYEETDIDFFHCDKCNKCHNTDEEWCEEHEECHTNLSTKYCDKCDRCVPYHTEHCTRCNNCHPTILNHEIRLDEPPKFLSYCEKCKKCTFSTFKLYDDSYLMFCRECFENKGNGFSHCKICEKMFSCSFEKHFFIEKLGECVSSLFYDQNGRRKKNI